MLYTPSLETQTTQNYVVEGAMPYCLPKLSARPDVNAALLASVSVVAPFTISLCHPDFGMLVIFSGKLKTLDPYSEFFFSFILGPQQNQATRAACALP